MSSTSNKTRLFDTLANAEGFCCPKAWLQNTKLSTPEFAAYSGIDSREVRRMKMNIRLGIETCRHCHDCLNILFPGAVE